MNSKQYTKKDLDRFKQILQGETRDEALQRIKSNGNSTEWISGWLDTLKDTSFKIEEMLEKNDDKKEWKYEITKAFHIFSGPSNSSMAFEGDNYEEVLACIDNFIETGYKEGRGSIALVAPFENLKKFLTE